VQSAIDVPEGEDAAAAADASYEYLLSMSLSSLTLEKVQALTSEAEDWKATVERLRATTEKEMWRADLQAFELVGAVCTAVYTAV
jgi:DNA topoisomerase-2